MVVYGGLAVTCVGKEDEVTDSEAGEVARIQILERFETVGSNLDFILVYGEPLAFPSTPAFLSQEVANIFPF